MQLKTILQQVSDPCGKQGQDYKLWSILGLIILSLLCRRRGMKAAFVLGRSLSRRQGSAELCPRNIAVSRDADGDHAGHRRAGAGRCAGLVVSGKSASARHIAIDGKTMRASKDREGKAEHVLSAFCCDLQTIVGHEASRGKGLEIPDALKLLERLVLTGKIVTGMRSSARNRLPPRSSSVAATTSFRSKTIRRCCARIFKRLSTSRFFPLCSWDSGIEKAHRRIERRVIDVLPAEAAGIEREWPTVRRICRVRRWRQIKKNGEWQPPQHEVVQIAVKRARLLSDRRFNSRPACQVLMSEEPRRARCHHRARIAALTGQPRRVSDRPRHCCTRAHQ